VFFDGLDRLDDRDSRYPLAGRPAPTGWQRHELGVWVSWTPADAALPAQGWKVHVSVDPAAAAAALDITAGYCVAHRLPFKFLRSRLVTLACNEKYADRSSSGKLMALYPADTVALRRSLAELTELLAGFRGPYVLSDLRWQDGPLYVRYGGFTERWCAGADSEPEPAPAAGS
jgi:hypothetical protein